MKTRFNVCDLNAIETRVGAWLSGCQGLMDVFQPMPGLPNGRDPYIDFAARLYGKTYDQIYSDYKSKNETLSVAAKHMRQFAKPGVLGAIYRLGGGKWIINQDGDKVRSGLWGYAHNMGIEMEQEEAHRIVRLFRQSYSEIPDFWRLIEDKTLEVMSPKVQNITRFVGPNDCVKIDRLNISTWNQMVMRMELPSGRRLNYMNARIKSLEMPWEDEDGEKVYRDGIVYSGVNQQTKKWGETSTHGGKLFENLVQGIARDVLATKLMMFEDSGLPVIGHVHDEGICLVDDDIFSKTVEDMIQIMSEPIDWAPGLLLGADGFEDSFYHK